MIIMIIVIAKLSNTNCCQLLPLSLFLSLFLSFSLSLSLSLSLALSLSQVPPHRALDKEHLLSNCLGQAACQNPTVPSIIDVSNAVTKRASRRYGGFLRPPWTSRAHFESLCCDVSGDQKKLHFCAGYHFLSVFFI